MLRVGTAHMCLQKLAAECSSAHIDWNFAPFGTHIVQLLAYIAQGLLN